MASSHLDIRSYGGTTVKRIANTPLAISCWLGSLPSGCVIAMESMGRYHCALATGAFAAGFTVHLLNPRDVHSYARGLGSRGKTDRLDAQVIDRYAALNMGSYVYGSLSPHSSRTLSALPACRASVCCQGQRCWGCVAGLLRPVQMR